MNSKRTRKAHATTRQTRRKGNRPDYTTEAGIARRWAEGRGTGEGAGYKPWFRVPEFSSKGYRTMTMSAKFLRVIHLFSLLEWMIFLLLEVDSEIIGLKEQVPHDRDETRAIAAALGLEHPSAYGTDVVMTTDFVVEVRTATGATIKRAIAVKYLKDLRDRRTVEKLQIEQAYHHSRGNEFVIMTERDIPRELIRNATIVRPMLRKGAMADISTEIVEKATAFMQTLLGKTMWGKMVTACDAQLELRPGTSARIACYQIANRAWPIDLNFPLMSREPIRLISQ